MPSLYQVLKKKNMILAFLMGLQSGFPFLLIFRTFQAWMEQEGISLKLIGVFALVTLPYTIKVLWAPILDCFYFKHLRRKTWLVITQIGIGLVIIALSFLNPQENLFEMAILCFVICAISATQDIAIDAFRRESLEDHELGLGATLFIYGYNVGGKIFGGALALFLSEYIKWSEVFFIMGLLMFLSMIITFWADEPHLEKKPPTNLKTTLFDSFLEVIKREKAFLILAFIICYKLGDTLAGSMTLPFYLKLGFSPKDIALIAKSFGFACSTLGSFIGAYFILKKGIIPSLLVFGILQAVSTISFGILDLFGKFYPLFVFTIAFEDVTAGMGTAAISAFMATAVNKQFSGTQYALFTSLIGIPRILVSGSSGFLADSMGWFWFFTLCSFLAIPGLMMIKHLKVKKGMG